MNEYGLVIFFVVAIVSILFYFYYIIKNLKVMIGWSTRCSTFLDC